ncbi:MAG: 16S rRNA (cytosine(1402)-N(4))-methyltransferase RsmH [Rhodospirillaceae bacterium]|nr:16S rRNA (cytosine(1402)-N(4))-methyltransferase RsmH [Rhodospirillaceae bacterium]
MATTASSPHTPVMLGEVLDGLSPKDGGIYVDGTFGDGGYSRAVLNAASCTVYGIDRDPSVVARAHDMQNEFKGRFIIIEGRFGSIAELLASRSVGPVDGVAFDIGVSSMQIDTPERGFSFRSDGPLDMRMESAGTSASDVVNDMEETDLANIIYELGEERFARRVARAIVAARTEEPILRTLQLADIVRRVVPKSKDGIDSATRTFQALRIFVNDELGEIDRGMNGAEQVLAPGGRLCVVSFHSLEDRRVKRFFKTRSGDIPGPSRHMPQLSSPEKLPTFNLVSRKSITPSSDEQRANPRARSARLRVGERTDAPAWNSEEAA